MTITAQIQTALDGRIPRNLDSVTFCSAIADAAIKQGVTNVDDVIRMMRGKWFMQAVMVRYNEMIGELV